MFSITLAPHLADLEILLRTLDPHARVLAYLDDVYVAIAAEHAEIAVGHVRRMMADVGMEMRTDKTALWTLDPNAPVPAGAARFRTARLTCLGSLVPYVRGNADDEDDAQYLASRIPLLAEDPGDAPAEALRAYLDRLRALRVAGLSAQSQFTLA